MKYPFFRSIRTQLLILVMLSVIPALAIVIYSGFDRQSRDIENAKGDALRVLQSFASDMERTVESTRQLLMTLAQLPDVQNLHAAACDGLFASLLQENPIYETIFAVQSDGTVFANALPFVPHSEKNKKYFQDILRRRDFSVGEYVMGITPTKPILHFAYPIINARGEFKGAVAVAFRLGRYDQMFTKTKLPEDSVLGIYDHRHVRLCRSHEPEKYVGRADSPEMVRYMSAPPEEGSFTATGNDGVKRFMAYRRFYLKGSSLPYLSMRVGIAERQALARARNTLFSNVALLCAVFVVVMALAWFLGNIIIVRRLKRLVDATQRLGRGDLTARTELGYREDELGQLTKSFDEMAGKLESKERDRLLAQVAIQESENKYRTLVDNLNMGIYRSSGNPQGRFIQANPALAKMFGYDSVDDIMQISVSDLYQAPEERKLFVETLSRSGSVTSKELRLKKKNGQLIWTSVTARAHFDAAGNIDWTDGVIEDITERKQSEEDLREKEKIFRLLFEKSGDGNLLIDNGVFTDCNDAALRMLGCPEKGQLLRRRLSEISPEKQPDGSLSSEKELALLAKTLQEGQTRFEWHHRTYDGRNLFVDVMLTAVPMKGRPIIYTAWRDVTDKKIIEQELIHREKLSSLGMLVTGISHEINNPNNFIVFNIPILREYFKEIVPIIDEYAARHPQYTLFGMTYDEFREDLFKLMDNIQHGADRINRTVSNLQEFARKKVRGPRKQIRLQDILDKAVTMCRSQINKSTKSFEVCVEEGLPSLSSDPEALEQVLINLLINATQAMCRKDSLIKVRLFRGASRSAEVVIEVMDNGVGFDERTKARLFEPFFTTKPIGMGTGIGLYIVKRIITDLGGRIEVISSLGEGSIFRVILPGSGAASGQDYGRETRGITA